MILCMATRRACLLQAGRFFTATTGGTATCRYTSSVDQDGAASSVEELQRIVAQLLARWPKTHIMIRGDCGCCRDNIMSWREEHRLYYVLGLARNVRLNQALEPEMEQARIAHQHTGKVARRYRDFRYRTHKSWLCERRVVGKAGYLPNKPNPRFVVTNLPRRRAGARCLYEELYCARGEMENRIKEQ